MTSLVMVACDQDSALTAEGDWLNPPDGTAAFSLMQLSDLAVRKAGAPSVGPVVFPDDLGPHPDAAAESHSVLAVLSSDDGEQIGVQVQLDRLALDRSTSGESAWEYSDVMRSSVLVSDPALPETVQGQQLQRRALGLADSTASEIRVNATRMGQDMTGSIEARRDVPGDCRTRFDISTILPDMREGPDRREASMADGDDVPSINKRTGQRLDMQLELRDCPTTLEIGNLRQWTARAISVIATFSEQHQTENEGTAKAVGPEIWQGRAWLSNGWGALPGSAGAVVIDTVELFLDPSAATGSPESLLSVTRSKRRSGRGPETVQGALTELPAAVRTLDWQWVEPERQPSTPIGHSLPAFIQINSADESYQLLLTPLKSPSVQPGFDGNRWRGAVTVSGTHKGVGFVDYQPLQDNENMQQEVNR